MHREDSAVVTTEVQRSWKKQLAEAAKVDRHFAVSLRRYDNAPNLVGFFPIIVWGNKWI